ncbi:MAG: AMP-binding protein [Alphaproteobacteria bacterium]
MSVANLFRERAMESPSRLALRYKVRGVYRDVTWSDYLKACREAAAVFVKLGLKPGDSIAIMEDVSFEYLSTHMGAVLIGLIPFGIYPTSSGAEVQFLLRHGGARIAIAGTQEHLDKLLLAEKQEGEQLLDHILLIDKTTRFVYTDERISLLADLLSDRSVIEKNLPEVDAYMESTNAETPVGLIFTSGTTSNPKGAYYSNSGMMIGLAYGLLEVMPDLRTKAHRVITHLPLAHGMGQALAMFVPLLADVIQHLPERGETLITAAREVRPTHLLAVPRIWQKVASTIQVEIATSGKLRKWVFAWAVGIGRRYAKQKCDGRVSFISSLLFRLARATVLWPALNQYGMAHVSGCASGGAPMPAGLIERWQSWGLPLRNIYGSTEGGMMGGAMGIWAHAEAPLYPPYPRRVEGSKDGEILVSGAGIFCGYWQDESATHESIDPMGRVLTGDIAVFLDDGGYRIVDRKKDILITGGGKNISPAAVESALKRSAYISEAVIFGEGEKYITALIEIDFDALSGWAREEGLPFSGFSTLIVHPDVLKHMRKEIDRANEFLSRPEQVKYFRLMPKQLDPEEGDTTATRKIKRNHAYAMFKPLVDEMYHSKERGGSENQNTEVGVEMGEKVNQTVDQ